MARDLVSSLTVPILLGLPAIRVPFAVFTSRHPVVAPVANTERAGGRFHAERRYVRALNEGHRGLGQAVACELEGAALGGSFDEIYGWSGGMR